jgi:hypothetical protein
LMLERDLQQVGRAVGLAAEATGVIG